MKKYLVFLAFICLYTQYYAQFSKFKNNPFSNTLLFNINSGISQSDTDFRQNDNGFALSGSTEYFFSSTSNLFFALKFKFGYTNISGNTGNLTYDTDVISAGPYGTLNLNLGKNFFPYVGIGLQNLWYKDFTSFDISPEIGIRILLSKYFAVHGNVTLNFLTEDNIDNLKVLNSHNDFFSTLSIGFSYAVDLTIKDDIDEDGILNIDDECPEQSEDFDGFEDGDGCPEFDNDQDGIVDTRDSCVNESEDFDGFEDGDGCPDPDNDNDGIPDYEDNCPDLKEDIDNFNDLDGCPDLDNDNDGIVDLNDKCPDLPETFNNFEDFDGCPDELPQTTIKEGETPIVPDFNERVNPEKNIRISIPNEFLIEGEKLFNNGSAQIKPEAFKKLNSIADQMKKNIEFRWRIEGHLDNSGSDVELKLLSTRRANAVKNYLVSKGLPPQLFQTIGLGDEVPIAPNSTIQGKLKNRRILIKRIK